MIAIKINDIKVFMGKLLVRDVFDEFLLEKAQILTASQFTLSGKRNQNWYDSDQWTEMKREFLGDCSLMYWKELKNIVFTYIKGDQSPDSMRISFKASRKQTEAWLEDFGVMEICRRLNPDLFLMLRYEQKQLMLTTGMAVSQFQTDRTVERAWDEAVLQFLHREQIAYEEV